MKSGKGFLTDIQTGVIIGDGALGTELVARGARTDISIEKQNITAPELVLNIHKEYIQAGSSLIETNTFGANRLTLTMHNSQSDLEAIIREGVSLAKQAAGSDVYVAGSIGPLPSPDGEPLDDIVRTAVFAEQIGLLLENQVDVLLFESFSDADELAVAVKIARSMTDICIIAQAAYDLSGYTADGTSAVDVGRKTLEAGADVIGANCGYGIPSIASAVKQFAGLGVPLSAFINAGFPEQVDGRLMYMSNPEYLAKRARDLVNKGVRLIGGCCGTNPESIRAITRALADTPAAPDKSACRVPVKVSSPVQFKQSSRENPASWKILVELDPPTQPNLSGIIEAAKALKQAGADAVTVADNPLASVRVDTLTTAVTLQREAGMTAIPHLTGRDRNKIALQSTFMGACVAGIGAFLCITGDPIRFCQQPNTSGVFDVNSIGLTGLLADFNRSQSESDADFCPLSIGVAVNPNVRNLGGQIDKLKRKIDAGATFALTQPLFSQDRLEPFIEALKAENITVPVFTGILPLTSFKNAEFIHNEVPGIYVPDFIRNAMEKYESVADQRAAAMDHCLQFVESSKPSTHGFYLIAPRNQIKMVLPIIETIH